ncbi:carboxylesterase/lipase family protein [Phenylobacterium sp.]|jgi:para-nitrobenzyl esterase|uniref:carboxylesterase/lipase family protein n=1 Tax=Phenylobacterium sp. TaxID=1871053 RepID=UPI002E35E221|nr:carboxylesterase/lipase family protein [Phenylobacterium sp.]HEX3367310.1 carboxylesterase/lipase family protein [Phenylobacterium sp.]
MGEARDGVARRGLLTAGALGGLMAAAPAAQAKPGGSAGAGTQHLSTPPSAIVETRSGKVRGCVRQGVHTFKGIPYGRTTAGAARFLPAEAPAPWKGVRSALSYGPCCPQVVRGGWQSDETAFIYDWDDGYPGEDCLRLNIWSGGVTGKARPVMVWIHGGGYETGSSQELPAYDGERLARKGDLVFVSVNHRLGAFGFLDLSSSGDSRYAMSGNAGQLDLVVALQWVRDNIAAFGGDPSNVTIFGQSGGGAKVSTLMAMPSARGLFHKAIVESGSLLDVGDTGYTKRLAEAVLKNLDIAPGELGKLASVPPMALVAAAEKAKNAMPKPPPGKINLGWAPVVDGTAIPGPTWANGAPALSANVPMIIGTNLNEFSPSLGNTTLEDIDEDRAKATARSFGGASPAAWAAFRSADPKAKPVEILSRVVSAQFRVPAVVQAQTKARQGAASAYLYRFDYNPKTVLHGRVRAFHCAEMAYAFDNVDRCLNATGGTAEARALSARMSDAWIAFARTGNPNHKGLPHWPAVSTAAIPNMLFDAVCTVKDDPDRAQRAALA